MNGSWNCVPRCSGVHIKLGTGKQLSDPFCTEQPSKDDKCCAVMVCSSDTDKPIGIEKHEGNLKQKQKQSYHSI